MPTRSRPPNCPRLFSELWASTRHAKTARARGQKCPSSKGARCRSKGHYADGRAGHAVCHAFAAPAVRQRSTGVTAKARRPCKDRMLSSCSCRVFSRCKPATKAWHPRETAASSAFRRLPDRRLKGGTTNGPAAASLLVLLHLHLQKLVLAVFLGEVDGDEAGFLFAKLGLEVDDQEIAGHHAALLAELDRLGLVIAELLLGAVLIEGVVGCLGGDRLDRRRPAGAEGL